MKKTILTGLAAVAALAFTACHSAEKQPSQAQVKGDNDKEVLYSGILPAADAIANLYTVVLDYDGDKNYTEGDYTMVLQSLTSDSTDVSGLKQAAVGYVTGDFKKATKEVNGKTVEYVKLTPEDYLGASGVTPFYFVVNEDGSLTMTAEDLEVTPSPLNYTLSVRSIVE